MGLDSVNATILILGDIMLDYKITGSVNKIANESPLPVFLKEQEEVVLGGCGNVAANLAQLGCKKIYLFSMCGQDTKSETLVELLNSHTIHHTLIYKKGSKTTSKHRYFCSNKLMFRYDDEETIALTGVEEGQVIEKVKTLLETNTIDCILFSDYNKGFMTLNVCSQVISLARQKGIFTCVDPKNDFRKYTGCSLLKPNRKEVETLFGLNITLDTLQEVHKKIKELVNCETTVITLGDKGISALLETNEYIYWKADTKDVIDVTGAGDIVNAVLAYYFNSSCKKTCLKVASYLATISVQHLGTYTLQYDDILSAQKFILHNKLISIELLKEKKKPILFTNGCFDILHEGHLSLLKFCKDIAGPNCDIVVALNSDKSIRSIKGPLRPICSEKTRVALLNSVEYVDWIILFDEETPERLLSQLRPEILVKGGDYTPETIIGKEYCKELKIFKFEHDISTTKILESLERNRQP